MAAEQAAGVNSEQRVPGGIPASPWLCSERQPQPSLCLSDLDADPARSDDRRATDDGLCLLEFTDRRMLEAQFDAVQRRFGGPAVMGSTGHLERLEDELAGYFAGSVRAFSVPMVYPGTPFQLRVWEMLQRARCWALVMC